MQRAYQQAWLFGARYALARKAVALRTEGRMQVVVLDDGTEIRAPAAIIATGAEYRRLGVPRVDRFSGRGVMYTAGADVALALGGRDLVVCGGGNSAGQAVVHLAKSARHIVHAVRGASLSDNMSSYLVDSIRRLPNVEVRFETEVVDADGERGLEQVTLRHRRTGDVDVRNIPALFVMIGSRSCSRPARRVYSPPATCGPVRRSASRPPSGRAPSRSALFTSICAWRADTRDGWWHSTVRLGAHASISR